MQTINPALRASRFPLVRRQRPETLQLDLGEATPPDSGLQAPGPGGSPEAARPGNPGPTLMTDETIDVALRVLARRRFEALDLSGAAPHRHPGFRRIVREARGQGIRVVFRTGLPAFLEPGQQMLAEFLAGQGVRIVGWFPLLSEEQTDRLEGPGTFATWIEALRRLNAVGYGRAGRDLRLDLAHCPPGVMLPAPQSTLRAAYSEVLGKGFGIVFDDVLAIANLPIGAFGKRLIARGEFKSGLQALRDGFREGNLDRLMCRTTVSVDPLGRLHDCTYNRQLGLTMLPRDARSGATPPDLQDLLRDDLSGRPVRVADHCFGCAAGQGSSLDGALREAPAPRE